MDVRLALLAQAVQSIESRTALELALWGINAAVLLGVVVLLWQTPYVTLPEALPLIIGAVVSAVVALPRSAIEPLWHERPAPASAILAAIEIDGIITSIEAKLAEHQDKAHRIGLEVAGGLAALGLGALGSLMELGAHFVPQYPSTFEWEIVYLLAGCQLLVVVRLDSRFGDGVLAAWNRISGNGTRWLERHRVAIVRIAQATVVASGSLYVFTAYVYFYHALAQNYGALWIAMLPTAPVVVFVGTLVGVLCIMLARARNASRILDRGLYSLMFLMAFVGGTLNIVAAL